MSIETATFFVAVGSFLVSAVAAVAGILAARYGREQLALGRERAEMRPVLEVSATVECSAYYEGEGTITVNVGNGGKTAAHNVHGWLYLHDKFFSPVNLQEHRKNGGAV